MKTQSRSRHILFLLILPAFLLFACTFSLPFSSSNGSNGGNGTGQITFQSRPDLLTDPTTGLADLNSYHVSFQQDVTGNLDGKPFERHTHIELTRSSGQSDFTREGQGTDEQTSYFRAIALDKAVYRWNTLEETCQGEAGDLLSGETLEPAELLPLVLQTSKVGNETVNQIPTIHYHFDQNALPVTEPKPSISGEIWMAEQGGYLVKFIMNAAMPSKTTGVGLEVAQSWKYELSQINLVESVTLPKGCMVVPVDIPVMPDAMNESLRSGIMEYETASSASEVVAFYFQNLSSLGWTAKQKEPTGELKLPLGLSFFSGDQLLSIDVDKAETGGLDVTLVIYNPNEQAAASTPATTPPSVAPSTPLGPMPTADASQSGLPADVPLYPGVTDMHTLPNGVRVSTSDSPEAVATFYHQQLPPLGWSLLTEMAPAAGTIDQSWTMTGRMLTIIIQEQDGKTTIMLILNKQ
jgi:hypothetical protein